ncbi:MAG: hypothetical protein JW944_09270, partial [Deltaproteobacteria bacterium]|nr:hypothetical protein [Deltaproteobacteria bacterium]
YGILLLAASRLKEIINRVNEACANHRSIEMVYYTMSRRKESLINAILQRVYDLDDRIPCFGSMVPEVQILSPRPA